MSQLAQDFPEFHSLEALRPQQSQAAALAGRRECQRQFLSVGEALSESPARETVLMWEPGRAGSWEGASLIPALPVLSPPPPSTSPVHTLCWSLLNGALSPRPEEAWSLEHSAQS